MTSHNAETDRSDAHLDGPEWTNEEMERYARASMGDLAETDATARFVGGWVRGDGTGFFMDCPRCHFYKNAASEEGDPCRSMLCTGTVERVTFQVTTTGQTSET